MLPSLPTMEVGAQALGRKALASSRTGVSAEDKKWATQNWQLWAEFLMVLCVNPCLQVLPIAPAPRPARQVGLGHKSGDIASQPPAAASVATYSSSGLPAGGMQCRDGPKAPADHLQDKACSVRGPAR